MPTRRSLRLRHHNFSEPMKAQNDLKPHNQLGVNYPAAPMFAAPSFSCAAANRKMGGSSGNPPVGPRAGARHAGEACNTGSSAAGSHSPAWGEAGGWQCRVCTQGQLWQQRVGRVHPSGCVGGAACAGSLAWQQPWHGTSTPRPHPRIAACRKPPARWPCSWSRTCGGRRTVSC